MKKSCNYYLPLFILLINIFISISLLTTLPAYFNEKVFLKNNPSIKEAMFYKVIDNGVQCELCPQHCFLPEGFRGKCRVRINSGGKLYTMVYGMASAINVDPIEKKPVYHLKPGSTAFSIATKGCNLRCMFCQNWQLSQSNPEDRDWQFFSPEKIVQLAKQYNSQSIAYTYSEPIVFYEYVYETAQLAKENGLYNVLVSAGYINKEPLEKLLPYLDVVKIDLKGFNNNFYKKFVGCDLNDILKTLKILKEHNKLVEIVNLIVPGLNDNFDEIKNMCIWIKENLGEKTPVFFTRFFPNYLLLNLPATDFETLKNAYNIAKEQGLQYVYIGNVPGTQYENTFCPKCGNILVKRYGYTVEQVNIVNGRCKFCGEEIPGIW